MVHYCIVMVKVKCYLQKMHYWPQDGLILFRSLISGIIRQHLKNFQLLRLYLFGQIGDLNKLKRLEMYWLIMWTMVVG